jgi:general secretion pathway protein D
MERILADCRAAARATRSPSRVLRDAAGRWLAVAVVSVLLAGCATTSALRRGQKAERLDDYDLAVAEYTKELRLHPDNQEARQCLQRVKMRAAESHYNRGRRLAASGRLDEALVEFQVASELHPTNTQIDKALRETRTQVRAKVAVERGGKTDLETLIDRTRDTPPPGLDLPRTLKLPASMVFRDAGSRDVLTALGRLADVNMLFDPAFASLPITIDLRDTTFEDALTAVCGSTRNFYRVTAPRAVTIVPDTPAKRREYEEEVVRTFYLGNADLKETIDLLRMVIDMRRLNAISAINAISVKDTPERIQAAGRLIAAIDKARPREVIDVELLEVSRTIMREYGLQVASPDSSGIDGAVNLNQDDLTLRNLTNLSQSGVFLTGVPALYYRLLRSDTSTRLLANPQLRTSEGIAASAKFGERIPVPTTTFSPIASGGVAEQPITSYNYENIGVNIDLTPRTHHNDEVSLNVKLEVSNISGKGYNDLPTFGNRSVTTVIRLKDGETSILGGLIRDDERTTLQGVPGLSDLPVVGRLFARNSRERQETDIILTLTPHIVRVLDLTEADLRPFRVAKDAGTSFIEMPAIETPPRDLPKVPAPIRNDKNDPKGPGGKL